MDEVASRLGVSTQSLGPDAAEHQAKPVEQANSFFQLLKRERIKRRIYASREEVRSDVFDYMELFYNTRRRHGANDQLSPVEYEQQCLNG